MRTSVGIMTGRFGWCVALAFFAFSMAGSWNAQQQEIAPKVKSIFSIELLDKNLDNPTCGELVEWLDTELRVRGAEEFGFKKVVLSNMLNPASRSGMGVEIKSMPLMTVLQSMQSTSYLDWHYAFGVLTIFSHQTEEKRACLFGMDSPLLKGIDFNNPDITRIGPAIRSRFSDLALFSVVDELNDGAVFWSHKGQFVQIYLARPDAEAAYALDQIMRESRSLRIIERTDPEE